ncbi:MAG TPA: DNA-directed RNA polymerase subunit alpha [Anaerolineaceae bacterium]|jgi:DNA-directed RNA polymerase subunit alpha|nr:DNA-directed RNA polymerase subunit alpha [Anaerolineales bacterium]HPY32503.1 DNA-directed RNA polymerase subunit alpha [Anaerolineaceae bacterium]HQC20623.1 DNA-directed RNA polymerase subunit alpha [Anaerolineaceae bacterium]HQK42413.1 DNA-directed RNA polymerase subunit alpha [Anaerolineaceae bacterium]
MVTPKVEGLKETRESGRFVISPLERGFGITLGNAIRRVLLSSLEGAAITAVRITDVMHEFSTIPGVREDVIQVMLNLKQIRMKLHDVDIAHLQLEVRGEGTYTAADILCPPEVEIINPELYLFSITDNDARVEMEFTVERGRGYMPAGDRAERLPIGVLPVDAIFSPVRRVNWSVTNARVGHNTNFDKLNLEIQTDGTLAPEAALQNAVELLIRQFSFISGNSEDLSGSAPEDEIDHLGGIEAAETQIEALDLTVRVYNALKRNGVSTVRDVREMLAKGENHMLSIRNFGDKSLVELKAKMIEKGFLKDEKAE